MRRIRSLDGLRGIAVLLVVAAHACNGVAPQNRPFAPWTSGWFSGGGLVGVQMFFVLSGYLITGILLQEVQEHGRLNLQRFWIRRLRRLYPALVGVCAGYAAYAWLLHVIPGEARGTIQVAGAPTVRDAREQLLNALSYTANFQLFGPWGWLGHTWSLAVEEQFYVAWAILFALAWPWGRRAGLGTIGATAVLATMFARMGSLDADLVDRCLRWDAISTGCLLALTGRGSMPIRWQWRIGTVGWTVLALYVFHPTILPMDRYTATSLASTAVLWAAPGWKWLENPVLRYFGRVSYSLYLWHVLILRFALPGPVGLMLSLAAAHISYEYVEQLLWKPM